MSKLLAIVVPLKAILIAASFALARGDMLSVILISALFNLTQLGAKLPARGCSATAWRPRAGTIGDGLIYSTEQTASASPGCPRLTQRIDDHV